MLKKLLITLIIIFNLNQACNEDISYCIGFTFALATHRKDAPIWFNFITGHANHYALTQAIRKNDIKKLNKLTRGKQTLNQALRIAIENNQKGIAQNLRTRGAQLLNPSEFKRNKQ